MRLKVFLFSKSKRTTGATDNLIRSLKKHGLVEKVKWINYSKTEKIIGKKLTDKYITRSIERERPHLTIINNSDAKRAWIEKCKKFGVVSSVYHEYNKPLKERALEIGRICDFFYLSNTSQLKEYREKGVDAKFLSRGSSKEVHYPVSPRGGKYESEVAFIGKPRPGIRSEILEKVEKNFDLKVWGNGWEKSKFSRIGPRVGPRKYRVVCCSAKVILGINDGRVVKGFSELIKQGGFTSNRDRITMGCGGFFLTNYNEGIEEVFEIGSHLDLYRSPQELLEKIDFYLKHPAKRREIAYRGCTYIHSGHTFDHFAEKIIKEAREKLPEKLNLF